MYKLKSSELLHGLAENAVSIGRLKIYFLC